MKKHHNLAFIFARGENLTTEFKENVSSSLDREIVAFANTVGGRVYIGVTDKGEPIGVGITNKLKSRIHNIAQNCDPAIAIDLHEVTQEQVLIVEVKESDNKPHRCSSGFYIRADATTQKLTTQKIREFIIDECEVDFGALTCHSFDYKIHFSKDKFYSFLDKADITYNKRNVIQILENLNVVTRRRSKIIFNNTGALFFAKDLDDIYSHARVSCALFKGTDKRYVLDRKIFNQDILSNIESALLYLQNFLRLKYDIVPGELKRQEFLEIPRAALREALVNAVTHRDYFHKGINVDVEIYDDRVEISNFGGLPQGLSEKNFGKKSVPRNYSIATLMLRIGHIEKMGTGIKKIKGVIRESGLSPVKFEFNEFFTIIFSRKSSSEEKFVSESIDIDKFGDKSGGNFGNRFGDEFGDSFRDKFGVSPKKAARLVRILGLIAEHNFAIKAFAKDCCVSQRTIENDIVFLQQHQLIAFEGSPIAGKYVTTKQFDSWSRSSTIAVSSRESLSEEQLAHEPTAIDKFGDKSGGNFGNRFGDEFGDNFRDKFGVRPKKAARLVRILGLIAEQNFAVKAFAKDCGVSQRTIENDIIFLKQHQLIAFEGSPIAGKYVTTKQFDSWSKSKS